jgi:hypothetical protein
MTSDDDLNFTIDQIKLVDLFEAVMTRPKMYTIGGSFLEAIAYLDGIAYGVTHRQSEERLAERYVVQEVQSYWNFIEWLCDKFRANSRDVLESMADTPDATQHILDLYLDFKTRVQDDSPQQPG